MVDLVSSITNSQNFRAASLPQLNSLLGNFGIQLPALNAQGTITQSAMNALYATAASVYPAQFTASIQATIQALLVECGFLSTILFPLVMTAISNSSGAANATVSTAVTFPATLPSSAYFVGVDAGQDVAWWVSAKSTTGCTVNLAPPSGASVAAGSFNIIVSI
jgi:hypothetical protein